MSNEVPKSSRKIKLISEETRQRIVDLSLQGRPAAEISRMLSVNYKSVWRILKRFNSTGEVEVKKWGGDLRSKLTADQKNKILLWVDQDCLMRISDFITNVYEHFSIRVSNSTIQCILKDFHYTIKSVVSVPEKKNNERTLNLREEYAAKFRHLESTSKPKNFIFLDIVVNRFSVVSRPKRGRSRQGISTYVPVSAAKSRNISGVAAMNRYEMIFHKIYDKAVTKEDFKQCLIELKAATVSAGIENPIYIIDNAGIHYYRGLLETINKLSLNICYLFPYSPFLSPIENIFSVWKNLIIRGEARCEKELKEFITSKFNDITKENCDGFYRKNARLYFEI